jgi:quercetin dioxygenase-like cupin family protein
MAITDLITRSNEQQHETFDWGSITWVDSAELTASDALTVGRVTIDSGAENPEHYHPNCDETLYLLEGTIDHWVGDESTTLEPGDCLHIPQGKPHRAVNVGEQEAIAVIAYDTGTREFEPVE